MCNVLENQPRQRCKTLHASHTQENNLHLCEFLSTPINVVLLHFASIFESVIYFYLFSLG